MMEWMRKSAPVIIIVIVIVFGLTSIGLNELANGPLNESIGSVAGQKVTVGEVQRVIENSNAQSQQMSDDEQRQLPMTAWEQIVSQKIMEIVAKEMQLDATPREVLQSLKNNPPAQLRQIPYFADEETQQFSLAKYQAFMSTPEAYDVPMIQYFEQMAYSQLPNMKVYDILQGGNVVSPSEVEAQYHYLNDKVAFEYVSCRPHMISIAPEQFNDDAIAAYYNANKSQFTTDEQAELYFVKLPKVATAYDEQVISQELLDCKTRILDGSSTFEDEADIESDDERTRADGGVIGWLDRSASGDFAPVFDLAVGEYSAPIKSRAGIHLVRVDSVDGNGDSARAYVRHIMKEIVPTPVTLDSIDALGDEIYNLARTSGLAAAVEELSVKLDSTGLFAKGDVVDGIGYFTGLGSFAFDEDIALPELFSDQKNLFIVAVKERVSGTLPLERVTALIKRTLRDSLQMEAAHEYIASVQGTITGSLVEYAKTDSLLIGAVVDSAVARPAYISGIGRETAIVSAAFSTELNSVSGPIVEDSVGVFLVMPTSVEIADTVPSTEYESIERGLVMAQNQTLFAEWYKAYRAEAGVTEEVRNYFY